MGKGWAEQILDAYIEGMTEEHGEDPNKWPGYVESPENQLRLEELNLSGFGRALSAGGNLRARGTSSGTKLDLLDWLGRSSTSKRPVRGLGEAMGSIKPIISQTGQIF